MRVAQSRAHLDIVLRFREWNYWPREGDLRI